QLRLGRRGDLVVHAPQRAGAVVDGDVALDDFGPQPVLRHLAGAERTREEAAGVVLLVQLDDECPLQGRLRESHGSWCCRPGALFTPSRRRTRRSAPYAGGIGAASAA